MHQFDQTLTPVFYQSRVRWGEGRLLYIAEKFEFWYRYVFFFSLLPVYCSWVMFVRGARVYNVISWRIWCRLKWRDMIVMVLIRECSRFRKKNSLEFLILIPTVLFCSFFGLFWVFLKWSQIAACQVDSYSMFHKSVWGFSNRFRKVWRKSSVAYSKFRKMGIFAFLIDNKCG